MIVTGGVININITGTADKGISTDGEVRIDGGRTTILTSGGYEYDSDDKDYSACSGIKADSLITINGGELNIKSTGTGGKGLNCDDQININDGVIRIITTGKRQKDSKGSVSPKGIKAISPSMADRRRSVWREVVMVRKALRAKARYTSRQERLRATATTMPSTRLAISISTEVTFMLAAITTMVSMPT